MEYYVKPWAHQIDAITKSHAARDMALFWEMGCLGGDSKIKISRGGASKELTIAQLFKKHKSWDQSIETKVRSFDGEKIKLHRMIKVLAQGVKLTYSLTLNNGKSIRLTADHEVLTKRGWVEAKELKKNDFVACDVLKKHMKKVGKKLVKPKIRYSYLRVGEFHPYSEYVKSHKNKSAYYRVQKHRLIAEARKNGLRLKAFIAFTFLENKLSFVNPKTHHIHHIDHNHKNNDPKNLQIMTAKQHLRHHCIGYDNFGHGQVDYSSVISVKKHGYEMTYDIVCDDPHRNFVANGIVVHNCGKTATTINIIRYKYQVAERVMRTLVLCPLVVLENWKEEFMRHAQLPPQNIVVLSGTGKRKYDQILESIGEGKIIVTNYEVMQNAKIFAALQSFNPEIVVCDESQRLKSPTSKRSKAVYELSKSAKHRYLLSGTPVLNSPLDIFQQYKILDGGETFGQNFFAFRANYFEDKNAFMPKNKHFPNFQPRRGAVDELARLIGNKALRTTKEECLDLPDLIKEKIYVEMGNDQQKAYKEMRDEFITFIKSETEGDAPRAAVAQLAVTKALRLQQIVSGFVTADDGSVVRFDDVPRTKALADLLEDLAPNHKVIVWACFKENYKQIKEVCDQLNIKYGELHGAIADKQGQIEAFRKDDGTRVIIANPASAGIGVNLVEASYSIYFSKNFSLEQDVQSEARNHRGGSEIHQKITRIDLVAKGTIDEQVNEALSKKLNVAEHILDWEI